MTNTETLLDNATTLLSPFAKATNKPEANRLDVTIEASELVAATKMMRDARWGYLAAITGLDHLNISAKAGTPTDNSLEALYHFCDGAAVVTLRTSTPRENAVLPTICGVTGSLTSTTSIHPSGTPSFS